MTFQSCTLPDCVPVHTRHPVIYTLIWVEVALLYLCSAHIKIQPGVVASSKLLPFEILLTSWTHAVPVHIIRLHVRKRCLNIDSRYLWYSWVIYNIPKASGQDADQTPCIFEPQIFAINMSTRLQRAVQVVNTITQTTIQHNWAI